MIPESKIAEVRERVDLIALMQTHGVELKKSGRSYKGRCPFHNEKTPSFHVWPDEKRFKCFGCQAGGDSISFVQRLLGKPFLDTVRDLAKECGVDLEAAVDPAQKEKAQLKEAVDAAWQVYQAQLWEPSRGRKARDYLNGRGVTEDVARSFGLGWAPNEWTTVSDRLRELGLLAFAERAGLVRKRPNADGYYDFFRGRLMIPIRSPEGRVIAFGGRLVEGDMEAAKYFNSPESRLYNKSETLYGLDVAREEIRRSKTAVLCEGYFDCIGLHQAGVKNAVALCSTALTAGHLAALQRAEAKELVLLLDGDAAGRTAVERLAGPILAAGATARVAVLPEGEDPDTFARKAGDAGIQALVKAAPALSEHLFKTVLPEGAAAGFEAKMAALQRLKPVAQALPVGLARSAFFAAMAAHFGLKAVELETELRGKPTTSLKPAPKPQTPEAPKERAPELWEVRYAASVMRVPRLLQRDTRRVGDELSHLGLRTLVALIGAGQSPQDALYEASEGLKQALAKAGLPETDEALEQAFATVCQTLKLRFIDEHLRRLGAQVAQAAVAHELTEETKTLLAEQQQLRELRLQVVKEGKVSGPPGGSNS